MTASQIQALPARGNSRILKASDTGDFYLIAANETGASATIVPGGNELALALVALLGKAPAVSGIGAASADSPVTLENGWVLVFADATLGDITLYLPEIAGGGDLQTLLIKRTDTVETNTVTILPAVADVGVLIEGEASRLILPLGATELSSDNTNWWVTRGDPAGDEVTWIP